MTQIPDDIEVMPLGFIHLVAKITGASSAAAKAIKDHEEMKSHGTNPVIGYSRKHSCLIVVDIGHV